MIAASESYSSTDRAELLVGDHRLSLARVGADKVTIRNPIPMEPAQAEIVLQVDGSTFRYAVYLTDGISAETEEVRYRQTN